MDSTGFGCGVTDKACAICSDMSTRATLCILLANMCLTCQDISSKTGRSCLLCGFSLLVSQLLVHRGSHCGYTNKADWYEPFGFIIRGVGWICSKLGVLHVVPRAESAWMTCACKVDDITRLGRLLSLSLWVDLDSDFEVGHRK